MKYSTVTARVSDLHEMGYVDFKAMPTNGQSWIIYVEDEARRSEIRKEVETKKREAWEKKGKAMGWL